MADVAALSGYGAASEDGGFFLLALGQQDVLTGPNLVDSGDGAALAWSPDARWLAVGAVGAHKRGDNAQLRVFDAPEASLANPGSDVCEWRYCGLVC